MVGEVIFLLLDCVLAHVVEAEVLLLAFSHVVVAQLDGHFYHGLFVHFAHHAEIPIKCAQVFLYKKTRLGPL